MFLELAAVTVTGWLAAGKGEWCDELCGLIIGADGEAQGGALADLKAETGLQYPALEAKRQEVVDAWRVFERAWPWGKSSAKAKYEAKAQDFATALEAEIMAVPPAGVALGGFIEQLKGQSPIVWVAAVALLVIVVVLVAFRK